MLFQIRYRGLYPYIGAYFQPGFRPIGDPAWQRIREMELLKMKLGTIAKRFEGVHLVQEGVFSSCGFCELHNTADMLVYITSETYIVKAKKNPNVRSILTTPLLADQLLGTGYGLLTTDDPAGLFCEIHNTLARSGLLYHINHADTVMGEQCSISPAAYIAPRGVVLGSRVVVEPGAVILENVTIGDDCTIGANTVVGTRGFQFPFVGSQRVYMEHVGGVRIGDRVDILSGTTISCGLFEPTLIEDDVKIDNLVQIAHSDKIGSGTVIATGAKLCGSVHIGKDVWIGANSSVSQFVEIEDGAYICIGAVVAQRVRAGAKVSGNFAEDHVRRVLREKKLRSLLHGKASRD